MKCRECGKDATIEIGIDTEGQDIGFCDECADGVEVILNEKGDSIPIKELYGKIDSKEVMN